MMIIVEMKGVICVVYVTVMFLKGEEEEFTDFRGRSINIRDDIQIYELWKVHICMVLKSYMALGCNRWGS